MSRHLSVFPLTFLFMSSIAFAQEGIGPNSDEFVFRFDPPNGTRVTTVYTLQRTRTIEGQPQVRDESESKSEGYFTKVGDGFEFAQKTLSSSMRRNGSPVDDPISGLLAQVPFTSIISADGALTEIKGFAEVESLVKSKLPPQLAEALAPVLSESALVNRGRSEWNARYADFAGAKMKIGDSIDVQAPQPLPGGGALTYTIRTTFPRWETCPVGRCVRIEQIYESDAAALAQMATGISQRVLAATSAPSSLAVSADAGGSRVTGSLSRLIDPSTMIIYSERVERTLVMQMQIPGKGPTPVTQHEVRSYSHTYDKP